MKATISKNENKPNVPARLGLKDLKRGQVAQLINLYGSNTNKESLYIGTGDGSFIRVSTNGGIEYVPRKDDGSKVRLLGPNESYNITISGDEN